MTRISCPQKRRAKVSVGAANVFNDAKRLAKFDARIDFAAKFDRLKFSRKFS